MKIIINVLLLLATTYTFCQNTLSGIVIDSQTQEPIIYATIYLADLEKGTATDENGKFSFSAIPAGTHKLVVSYVGYETFSIPVEVPNQNNLSIALRPTAIEMEEVIISTPFHKLQSENVMKVEQKKVTELKTNGAITLADGIKDIPGVASVTTGLGIGKPVIRGLSSNRVLVYTQGVRLENQQFGGEHGLGLNDAGVESVEVIKGPASLLYGSDAIGGVLYLNPEKFAQPNTVAADFNGNYFSNTQGYSTNAGYKSSGEHFKFLFRGSLTEHADYNTDEYRVTNSRFREQDFKAGIGYQSTQLKTELRYNVNHSKLGLPEEIGIQSTNKAPMLPYQDLTNHILSSKSTVYFENSRLDLNLGLIYNDRKEFEEEHHHDDHDDDHEDEDPHEEEHDEHEMEAPSLHMKLKTFNYDAKYHLPKLGKFETIVGLQGMHQTNSNYGEEELIPDATTNDIGILATSHIHLKALDIQLGARYDNRNIDVNNQFSKDFNSFNGALGFKTNLFKRVTARLNFASGFRAPNLAELTSDGVHHGSNRYEIGNANLNNEQNFQTDLALEFKNEHIEIFANGFYNAISDYIYLAPDGTVIEDTPVYYYVQENANLYGGEFGFHLHPHPLDWLHFESSFETVTGKQDSGDYLPLIPANSLNNTVRIEFANTTQQNNSPSFHIKNNYAFIKLQSTFKQNNISDFETATDGYNLLSAGFGATLTLRNNNEIDLSVSGTNLTNTTYINHLSRLKSDGIYNMGRNFSFGLSYRI